MNGLVPRRYNDHRRYSFARTFGSNALLIDCDFDTGLLNPDQNAPNSITGDPIMPNGCTGETRADIATNEDHLIYRAGFTYKKTCLIEGVSYGQPCTLESSFKSGIDYGLQAVGEITDDEALVHRRGPYFEVHPVGSQDYFTAMWNAIQTGEKCISVGSPWYIEMTEAIDGIVDNFKPYAPDDWHNWEACGVKTTDQPRIKIKAWDGKIRWFNRETINNLMQITGTDCLTDVDGKATINDIQSVRLTVIQTIMSYLHRLIGLLTSTTASMGSINPESWFTWLLQKLGLFHAKPVPEVQPTVVNIPVATVAPKPQILPVATTSPIIKPTMPNTPKFAPMVIRWAQAIGHWEGADPVSNNLGNLKYSTLTASWGATKGRAASDGGFLCHFATPEAGQDALCNFLTLGCENELVAFHQARTFIEFTMIYAGNPPMGYVNGVANILGIPLGINIASFLTM